MFNKQQQEINAHAQAREDQRKQWTNWQKNDLLSSYKEDMARHQAQKEMSKLQEKKFAEEFGNTVKNQNLKHENDIKAHQTRQKQILDNQANTIIEDKNERKK